MLKESINKKYIKYIIIIDSINLCFKLWGKIQKNCYFKLTINNKTHNLLIYCCFIHQKWKKIEILKKKRKKHYSYYIKQ